MSVAVVPSYKIKRSKFFGREVPIVLQNENGPCPLLGIANVLLLRNILQLPSAAPDVSQDRLLALIAEHLLDSAQEDGQTDPSVAANQQQNVADAIAHLPKLTTGIDVNVRFDRGVHGFEFTNEVAVFDLLGISLVHGWLLDSQNEELARAVGGRSYNELVCWLIPLIGQDSDAAQKLLQPWPSAAAALAAEMAAEAAGEQDADAKDDRQALEKKRGQTEAKEDVEAAVSALVTQIFSCVLGRAEKQGAMLAAAVKEDLDHRSLAGMSVAATAGESSAQLSPVSSLNDMSEAIDAVSSGAARQGSKTLDVEDDMHGQRVLQGLEETAKPDPWTVAMVQNFLDSTASQLTDAGLAGLLGGLRQNELAVFFRNNHFSTIFNHEGGLYLLVTDIGFLHESEIVWERLDSVHGATTFFTSEFDPFVPHADAQHVPEAAQSAQEVFAGSGPGTAQQGPGSGGANTDADYALALAIQEEMQAEADAEERRRREAAQQQQQRSPAPQQQQAAQRQQQAAPKPQQSRQQHHQRRQPRAQPNTSCSLM